MEFQNRSYLCQFTTSPQGGFCWVCLWWWCLWGFWFHGASHCYRLDQWCMEDKRLEWCSSRYPSGRFRWLLQIPHAWKQAVSSSSKPDFPYHTSSAEIIYQRCAGVNDPQICSMLAWRSSGICPESISRLYSNDNIHTTHVRSDQPGTHLCHHHLNQGAEKLEHEMHTRETLTDYNTRRSEPKVQKEISRSTGWEKQREESARGNTLLRATTTSTGSQVVIYKFKLQEAGGLVTAIRRTFTHSSGWRPMI